MRHLVRLVLAALALILGGLALAASASASVVAERWTANCAYDVSATPSPARNAEAVRSATAHRPPLRCAAGACGSYGALAPPDAATYTYDRIAQVTNSDETSAAVVEASRQCLSALEASRIAAKTEGGIIYRTGSRTPHALTDSSGVSFRDSVSSSTSAAHPQVFRPGDKIWGVDTSRLPPGSVVRDGRPPGHVSVSATPEQITAAIIDDPFLAELGLKRLDDFGAYRLPK